jgi:16S rRNA (cytidine1402-2'-O)-methyltransferase
MTATLYLIPSFLSETSGKIIPEQTQQIAARLKLFFAENPKQARKFLKRIVPAIRLEELQIIGLDKHQRYPDGQVYLKLLEQGEDAGLITDCGCPAVADPGSELVAAAHKKGIVVRPLVGPSSILLALMASGFNGQHFAFHGYLPVKKNSLRKALKQLESESQKKNQTQIFIETPYRNLTLLETMSATLRPHTRLCIACELTGSEESIKVLRIQELKQVDCRYTHKKPCVFLIDASGQ